MTALVVYNRNFGGSPLEGARETGRGEEVATKSAREQSVTWGAREASVFTTWAAREQCFDHWGARESVFDHLVAPVSDRVEEVKRYFVHWGRHRAVELMR